MEPHCFPASKLPHTSALYAAFLDDFLRVAGFYPHAPNEEGLVAAAREVMRDAGRAGTHRAAVVEILRGQHERLTPSPDPSVERNLGRLAGGAVAIVTGQQVGLFGGPAYSVYKALSAIRIARQLTERGVEAVPVFWLATEDHDLAEINHTFVFNPARVELERYSLEVENADTRRVGEIVLGKKVAHVIDSLSFIVSGAEKRWVMDALEDSYQAEATFGSAFARLFARLFAGRGLILLDPLDTRLHELAAPLFRQAIEEAPALTAALLAQNMALEAAGFHAQVKVTPASTLLFLSEKGARLAIQQKNGGFVAGRSVFSAGELIARLESSPIDFSPNALFRPLMQDTLLPTAAYLGGPAEIAYFAQARVLYDRLLGRMPLIAPRAGFTLVEPNLQRLLKKYSPGLTDLFRGRQHLRVMLERNSIPRSLAGKFERNEKAVRKLLEAFREPLVKLDPTLGGALDNAEKKMLFHFRKLREKGGRAAQFRTGVIDRHERLLTDLLFPRRAPQERSLSFLPFLASHGSALFETLESHCGLPAAASHGGFCHQVVFL